MTGDPVRATRGMREVIDAIVAHAHNPMILVCSPDMETDGNDVGTFSSAMVDTINDYRGQQLNVMLISTETYMVASPDVIFEIDNEVSP